MNRFTMTIGTQSIDFSEDDLKAMESAMTAATNLPGREIFRHGKSGQVSVVMHASGAERLSQQGSSKIQRLVDQKNGPADYLTDC